MENLSNKDIKQVVIYAMAKPSYLPFTRACFVVARLVQKPVEEVMAIVTPKEWTPEIVEAMRVPNFAPTNYTPKHKDIIF